jgi:hypothetical protein
MNYFKKQNVLKKFPMIIKFLRRSKTIFRNGIKKTLAPFEKKGIFPPFPFGTDFTKEELVLGKALRWLKERMAEGLGSKASSIGKAMTVRSVPEKVKPYLQRMQLDIPPRPKSV